MSEKVNVMVNGLPGKMAMIIAEGIVKEGRYELIGQALTGPNMPKEVCIGNGEKRKVVSLCKPEDHEEMMDDIHNKYGAVFAIDFTKGQSVADWNAEMYTGNNIPFVMGSTGADYSKIEKLAVEIEVPCVAAPNMDPQIVSFMDGIKYMAEHYPGSWQGYSFALSETHQADKKDTSGTMKAMLKHLGSLADRKLIIEDILSERDPRNQMVYWQVPQEWTGWHAYHIFKSFKLYDDVEDSLAITLKRHGGECYRQGTMMALDWLVDGVKRNLFDTYDRSKPVSQDNRRYFNTMFDVLKKS